MANKTMKTLTMNGITYEIVDETSRKNITNKVDKVEGKGLSTNDYTTTEKNKLAGIATGANKTVVDSALSSSSTNPVQNKVVNTAITNLNTLVGDTPVSTQISNAVSKLDMLTVDITNVDQGTATGINADTLGGKLPSEYLGKDEQAADSQKLGGKAPEYYAKQETINQLSQQIANVLPTVTTADSGKFLRVSSAGAWVAETVMIAEGVSF